MLIAGAINFVVFIERRNDYRAGGGLRRFVATVREVNGVDGRVPSSEIFAPGPDGRARPRAPIQAIDDLEAAATGRDDYGRWSRVISADLLLALLAGAIAGGGVLLLVASLIGWMPGASAGPQPDRAAGARPTSAAGGARRRSSAWSCCSRPAGWSSASASGCSVLRRNGAVRRRRARSGARSPGWRRWRPGPSRCGTRSPARSAWSRRSRRRATRRRRSSSRRCALLVDRLHTRDAAAGRAAEVRRRPRRPRRRPDPRRADPQRAAARARPARRAHARCRRPAREEMDMRNRIEAEPRLHPAQRADRHGR